VIEWRQRTAWDQLNVRDVALAALAALWVAVILRLFVDVRRQRQGAVARGAIGTLASVIVSALSLVWPEHRWRQRSESRSRPRCTRSSLVTALWSIAAQTYGEGAMWPTLYEFNHNAGDGHPSLTSPSLIEPGWRLDVPGLGPIEPTGRVRDTEPTNSFREGPRRPCTVFLQRRSGRRTVSRPARASATSAPSARYPLCWRPSVAVTPCANCAEKRTSTSTLNWRFSLRARPNFSSAWPL
jgi:hypothetical protein